MPRAKSAAALALTSAPGASMKIVAFSVFLIREAALPPAFSQSWTVRSAGLPRPRTTMRSTGAPSGATRSRAANDFAEKRAIFDALGITPAGSAISAPAAVSASDVFRRIARPLLSFADFENEISNFADMSSPMGSHEIRSRGIISRLTGLSMAGDSCYVPRGRPAKKFSSVS